MGRGSVLGKKADQERRRGGRLNRKRAHRTITIGLLKTGSPGFSNERKRNLQELEKNFGLGGGGGGGDEMGIGEALRKFNEWGSQEGKDRWHADCFDGNKCQKEEWEGSFGGLCY